MLQALAARLNIPQFLEPQIPFLDEFYAVQKRGLMGFEALNLQNI